VRGRRVLELGAGTGLAGIAAHALGARVMALTDLEYALENLRDNVRVNFEHFESMESGPVFVRRLDWLHRDSYLRPSDVTHSFDDSGDHWDVIIGADIVWLEELVPALVNCLETVMILPEARCAGDIKPNTVGYLSHQVLHVHVYTPVITYILACKQLSMVS
jgi:predicted nicotinamide N-methyase